MALILIRHETQSEAHEAVRFLFAPALWLVARRTLRVKGLVCDGWRFRVRWLTLRRPWQEDYRKVVSDIVVRVLAAHVKHLIV